MFDSTLDTEQAFGHHVAMYRTHVRRRRVTLTIAAVVVSLGLTGPVARAVAGPSGEPAARRTYVVRPGDTLWSIARRLAPAADPRPFVAEMQTQNGIDGGSLAAGQTLVVPSAS
jgi:Tfp pilus assembly protein FimV